jgi:hypothetical protein
MNGDQFSALIEASHGAGGACQQQTKRLAAICVCWHAAPTQSLLIQWATRCSRYRNDSPRLRNRSQLQHLRDR